MSKPDIEFIMERSGSGFAMYGCRGAGKGCNRNKYRESKKHCDDCVLADPNETIGDFKTRMERGDA